MCQGLVNCMISTILCFLFEHVKARSSECPLWPGPYSVASQPLQIKSVVAVEGLKGYIYVESYKQQFVKQAIEDIGNLRIGKWQQLMVPIKEMTDVLRVVKDTTGIKRGSWVRIKRSIYKDDIAQVSEALYLGSKFGIP